jgi:cytochrome c-type biogenesis protein CcmH
MIVVLVFVFGALSLVAAGFAVLPLFRGAKGAAPGRATLALAAGLGVLVCGLGVYAFLGQPDLALRALKGPDNGDLPSLIASLASRIRERPNDAQGWTILGRGYLALGQSDQAVKALSRAVELAKAQDGPSADLLISYGVALSVEGGMVTKDAAAAFQEAYDEAPTNPNARYYLGYAHAERGDKEGALKLWQGLVAVAPPDAPWRESLPAQLALLEGATPPNVQAMVATLAARLEANPKDLDGWIMLIRSYAALGDKDKAKAALAKARSIFTGDADAVHTLDDQAHASNVD